MTLRPSRASGAGSPGPLIGFRIEDLRFSGQFVEIRGSVRIRAEDLQVQGWVWNIGNHPSVGQLPMFALPLTAKAKQLEQEVIHCRDREVNIGYVQNRTEGREHGKCYSNWIHIFFFGNCSMLCVSSSQVLGSEDADVPTSLWLS